MLAVAEMAQIADQQTHRVNYQINQHFGVDFAGKCHKEDINPKHLRHFRVIKFEFN
jgi:hypothetical protein